MKHGLLAAVALTFVTSHTAIVFATQEPDALEALRACKAIEDKDARLACFDAIPTDGPSPSSSGSAAKTASQPASQQPAQAARITPPRAKAPMAPEAPGRSRPAPVAKPAAPNELGLDDLEANRRDKDKDDKPKAFTDTVVELSKTRAGKLLIIFESGQIWRQERADSSEPRIPRKYQGMTLTIERRMLGSYAVKFRGRWLRVERVK